MTKADDPLIELRSGTSRERLHAARRVQLTGSPAIISELRNLRDREPDSWVRAALDTTLAKLSRDMLAEETGQGWISAPADTQTEDIQASAIQNVAQVLIHEIRPLVRSITTAAKREVTSYGDSDTEKAVDRLREFLQTVERLQTAASPPAIVEFDLRDLVVRVVQECGYNTSQVAVFRTEPTIVSGDPGLLEIGLRNLVSNAVEASTVTGKRVTITFGTNDTESWVVVLDEGSGLPDSAERMWEPGRTLKSKKEHFGWGLSIAQRAVHSFGGTIALTPRTSGGTAGEIKWRHREAEPHDADFDR